MLRACRFTALLLAALALSTVPAHAPQLPEYLQYGALYAMGAIIATLVLAFVVRERPRALRWTLAALLLLSLWFLVWMMTRSGTIPGVYGHAGGFALQLLAFSALAASVLVDTPRRAA